MTKKCASCSFDNTDDATFCESCGSKMESFSPPPSPAPVAAGPPAPAMTASPLSPASMPSSPPAAQGPKVKCTMCGTENSQGNEFCDSCGAKLSAIPAASPILVAPITRLILPQGDEIKVDSYPRAMGRADFVRVNKSEYVSRKHFELSIENGKYYLADTNSTNGTKINNNTVTTKTELKDGDVIELGGAISVTFKAG